MRWERDQTDLWLDQWAFQRRRILGIDDIPPRERLGRLSCTLGAVREEGEGASYSTASQNFPEVYTGNALTVNMAYKRMNPLWRPIIEVHYLFPYHTAKEKAFKVKTQTSLYWKYISYGKNYVHAYMSLTKDLKREKRLSTQNTLQSSVMGLVSS